MKNDELNAATVERCAQVAERCEKATVREALERADGFLSKWGNPKGLTGRNLGFSETARATIKNIADDLRAALSSPAPGEDERESVIQNLINESIDPLKLLGEHLADWLDEDHWNNAEKLLLDIAARLSRQPEDEPVAWRYKFNGKWHLCDNESFAKQGLEAHPLYTSPRLDRERLARALCKSGKFDTGQGTCALVCMDQLGDPRKSGCSHCITVHGALADAIMRETR